MIIFIDDMNMPQVDTYGTQQPIALLKLLLEKGGMYDRGKDLNWKMFKDIFFIAAMGKVTHNYAGPLCGVIACFFFVFFPRLEGVEMKWILALCPYLVYSM